MKNFEFVNYDTEIKVAGKPFVLDCSSDTGDYLIEQAESLRILADEIKKGARPREDAIETGTVIIDHLLGPGATRDIFEGRTIRFSDVSDVIVFLTQTVSDFCAEREKESKK